MLLYNDIADVGGVHSAKQVQMVDLPLPVWPTSAIIFPLYNLQIDIL